MAPCTKTGPAAYEAERTQHLASLGIRVVRFENRAGFEEPEAMVAAIAAYFSTPLWDPLLYPLTLEKRYP